MEKPAEKCGQGREAWKQDRQSTVGWGLVGVQTGSLTWSKTSRPGCLSQFCLLSLCDLEKKAPPLSQPQWPPRVEQMTLRPFHPWSQAGELLASILSALSRSHTTPPIPTRDRGVCLPSLRCAQASQGKKNKTIILKTPAGLLMTTALISSSC